MNTEATKEITWTPEELAEFDRLIDGQSSRVQMTRLNARLDLDKFIKAHGKEKCDAMWAHLEARDAKAKKPKGKQNV
jgi:hypothetical protein